MTHHKNYKNESQDARRHDKQHDAHPQEKQVKHREKIQQNQDKKR